MVRREQEVRERARHHHQTQSGFDVTVRTTEAGGYTDEDTASMSEYTGQELIEPLLNRHPYHSYPKPLGNLPQSSLLVNI